MKYIFPLIVVVLLLSGCKKVFFEDQPMNNPEAVFDHLWKTFKENYGPFNERNIDWDDQYSIYRAQVTSETTPHELFQILSDMLAVLDDGHVNLVAPGEKDFCSNALRNNLVDDKLFRLYNIRRNYLESNYKMSEDSGYVYGKIKNKNIGYIYFRYVGDNFFVLNDFLNDNHSSDGIIIDLRHNQGGDFTYCFSEIGRLTNQSRFVFRSRTKNGKGENDFTQWYDWHIEPSGDYFNKPIVVLTDRYTISAGERATMAFMTLPNATIIGDTTCGAHSTMIGGELANGWYITYPTQNTELFDGRSYEGKGLYPEIVSKNLMNDVKAGLDKTLELAIEEF